MAYSQTLNSATPSGGQDARFLDDRMRELTAAIIERLLTIVVDVNADPLVLKANVVTTTSIADNAVTKAKLADAAVGTAELEDAGVTQDKLANNAVASAKIQDNAITQLKMADNSVGTPEIINDAVTTPKILDDAVTQPKIADSAVGTAQLRDAEVTAAKLAANAVETAKIADAAVTEAKLDAGLAGSLIRMISGTRLLTQAETSLGSGQFREFDVSCPGAVVGRPVIAQWMADQNIPGVGRYPAYGAPPPGPTGWHPGDEMRLQGWCIQTDVIRIRFKNRSGGALDMGTSGAQVTVWQLLFLTD